MLFYNEEGYASEWIDLAMNLAVVFLILFFITYTSEQEAIQANLVLTTEVHNQRKYASGLEGLFKQVAGENEHLKGDNEELSNQVNDYKSKYEGLVGVKEERDALALELEEFRQRSRQLIGLTGVFKNVVWVLDFSGSINETQRLNRYREEINLQIGTLSYERFNVITFYGDDQDVKKTVVNQWKPDWQTGTEATKEQAIQFVSEHPARGGTPTRAVLEAALAIPGIDTIVFFSDGQPTDGEGEDILDIIRKKNTNNVTVNVIAFGDYFQKKYGTFLHDLAEQNGGQFLGR